MGDICRLLWCALVGLFRSRASLEVLLLRHQLNVLRRKSPKRMAFTGVDRLVFAKLYHLAPGVLNALKIVKPETVIRWHRAGFRAGDQGRAEAGRRHRSNYAGSFAMSVWPTRSGARHGSMASCLSSALRSGRHGRQVHGQGEAPAIAGLENVH